MNDTTEEAIEEEVAEAAQAVREGEVAPAPMTLATDEIDLPTLGRLLVSSGFYKDTTSIAQAAIRVLAGKELGLGPIASMQNIYVVRGRLSLAYPLMAALIKQSKRHDYKIKELNDTRCELEFFSKRDDESPWESDGVSTFDMADAKRAGLLVPGGGWQKYPRNMLFARALSNGARFHCPDVFAGAIYEKGEMEA